ncbi:MAG: PKD domain-containing protein [Bacteroidota bacterium]
MNRKLLVFLWLVGNISFLFAQLPPNQPEQDCFNAIPVCSPVFVQANSYQGEGLNPLEINPQFSCLATAERNDVWYILTIQQAGDLAFTLTPQTASDDYDWAVYNLTNNSCASIFENATLEVSCNYAKEMGPTGPNGSLGDQFEAAIPVQVGGTYVINVSNFSGSSSGYTLDFTASTATILDSTPPVVQAVTYDCGSDEIQLSFSENVQCTSVALADFALTGPGGPYTIAGVSSPDCNSGGGFAQTYTLQINPLISQSGTYTLSLIGEVADNCGNASTFSSSQFDQSFPTVDAGSPLGVCENEDQVQLDATITSVFSLADISWTCNQPDCGFLNASVEDPSIDVASINELDSLIYYVAVRDVNGCAAQIDSVVLSILPVPTADAGADQLICELGPGVQLSGQPGTDNEAPLPFQFNWYVEDQLVFDNVANPFARPESTTTYRLQVSSLNGCVSTANETDENTVTVAVSPVPQVSAGMDKEVCVGDSILLSGTLLSGGDDLSYEWTPANTGFIAFPDSVETLVSPDFTTLYFLVARDSVCTSKADSVRVTVNPLPEVSLGLDQSICLGDTAMLAFSTNLGDNFSATFSPDPSLLIPFEDTELSAIPDTTSEYFVFVASDQGCISDTAFTTVTVRSSPLVAISPRDTTICRGDTISLQSEAFFTTTPEVQPISYRWASVPGITGSRVEADLTVSPEVDEQIYTLVVSNSGDCPFSDSVVVRTVAAADVRIQADTSEVCQGEVVTLEAVGGQSSYEYRWSGENISTDTGSLIQASPDRTGTYQLEATDDICVLQDSFRITVFATPSAEYTFGETAGCIGLDFQVQSADEPDVLYVWDFGDGSPVVNDIFIVHTYEMAGIFTVSLTAIGERGCTTINTNTQVEVRDTVSADFTSSPLEGEILYLPKAEVRLMDDSPNAVNWFWDFGDGNFSTDQNPVYIYPLVGRYEIVLTATDELGCVSTFRRFPYEVREPLLFIPNVFSPNGDNLHDSYVVQYEGAEETLIKIYDRWGNLQFESNSFLSSWDGKADGSEVPEGVYFYMIRVGEKAYEGELTLLR